MAKVTGFGGFQFKTSDPKETAKWFTEVLGLPTDSWGRMFPHGGDGNGYTVMGFHKQSSDYFGPSELPFMLNLRVDDLDAFLPQLEARGVKVLKRMPADEHGKFAHIAGPDGITIELWQPAE